MKIIRIKLKEREFQQVLWEIQKFTLAVIRHSFHGLY